MPRAPDRLPALAFVDEARQRAARWLLLVSAALAAACSPALDWRDWRPVDSGLVMLLPCKPVPQVRSVRLAGQSVRLALHACSAGGQTWAVAYADMRDPALVGAALGELVDSAAANLTSPVPDARKALAVPGATPHAASRRWALAGQLPDGKAVQEELAVFARGTVVFQATVLGAELPAEGVTTFFESLRFPS